MLLIAVIDALIMRTYHEHCYRQTMRKTSNMFDKGCVQSRGGQANIFKVLKSQFLWCHRAQITCPRIFMTYPQICKYCILKILHNSVSKQSSQLSFLNIFLFCTNLNQKLHDFFVRRKGRYLRTSGSFKPKKAWVRKSQIRKHRDSLDGRFNI